MIDNFSLFIYSICVAVTVFKAIKVDRAIRDKNNKTKQGARS